MSGGGPKRPTVLDGPYGDIARLERRRTLTNALAAAPDPRTAKLSELIRAARTSRRLFYALYEEGKDALVSDALMTAYEEMLTVARDFDTALQWAEGNRVRLRFCLVWGQALDRALYMQCSEELADISGLPPIIVGSCESVLRHHLIGYPKGRRIEPVAHNLRDFAAIYERS